MRDTDHLYASALRSLDRLRHRAVCLELAAAAVRATALAALAGLVWVALEAALYLPPGWRTGLGLAGSLAVAGDALLRLARRLPVWLRRRRLALLLESRYPELRQRLISTLELWPEPRARTLYSPALLGATVAQTASFLEGLDPRRVLDWGTLWAQTRLAGLVAVLGLASFGLSNETLGQALTRCRHPLTHFARPARTQVAVAPGDLEVVRGEDARLSIRFAGVRPRTATVQWREAPDLPWQSTELLVDRADSIAYAFAQVRRSFAYRVAAGDGQSPTYQVAVIDPPGIRQLRLEYHYPAYSGLPDRTDEQSGDLSGLAGTRVRLVLTATKPLAAAAVVPDDSVRMPARVQGDQAWAELTITRSGRYHLELVDLDGVASRDPVRYAIQVVEDAAPVVEIAEPGRDADLPESLQAGLRIEASDDFGVGRLELVYRLDQGEEQRLSLPAGPGRQVSLSHSWDLSGLGLLPEDRVYYRAEAWDNDAVSGPKRGASREYALRFPSLRELYAEVDSVQEQGVDTLEALARGEELGRRYLEKTQRELLRNQEMSWEKKKELEAALAQEEARARSAEEVARQLQETIARLEENGLASPELLDKLQEIRRLLTEVSTPELQQALGELQQAAEKLDPQDIARALQEFAQDQQAFQQSLDRTLALLKRVRAEQQLEAAARKAADLAQRQSQIDTALEQGAAADRLARQEEGMQRDAERLQQDLRDLGEQMREVDPPTAAGLETEAQAMQQQDLSGRMEQMAQRLQASAAPDARRLGESLEEDLGALSDRLQHLQGNFTSRQKEQLGQQLRQALHELVDLSRQQEVLAGETPRLSPETVARAAEDQAAVMQGAGQVAARIARVGQQTFSVEQGAATTLGYALRAMQQAAADLSQQDWLVSASRQQQAMGYLNETALLLRQSLDNLARAQTPSSFAEAMQKMLGLSEQQAGLNQATQEALGEGQQLGERGRGQDQRQRLARLVTEQQRIREALRELERGLRGNSGAQKRAQAIAEDMESVLRDLQQRRPDQRTLDTQKRIVHRMLDASRSLYTQDTDRRRRSTSGQDQAYRGPGGLPADLGQSQDLLRQAMKRALEGPYPEEYRRLIREYYELVYQDLMEREGRNRP